MIETKRLILKPLTYEQLKKYSNCDNSLESELNLNKTSRKISKELSEALEQTILPNVADKSKNYLYSTIWTAISKAENKLGFKPNTCLDEGLKYEIEWHKKINDTKMVN